MKVIQAGQILDYLGNKGDTEDICKWLANTDLDDSSVETLFYKAEGMRLFSCSVV
jgi:hypothetical protein